MVEIFNLLTVDRAEAHDVLNVPDAWTPILTLVSPPRDAGLYKIDMLTIWIFDSTNISIDSRIRYNGGAWREFSREAKDVNEKSPRYFAQILDLPAGPITIEIEAKKGAAGGVLDLSDAFLTVSRKG